MTALPYASADRFDYVWTERAYDRVVDGSLHAEAIERDGVESVTVSGPCPRCDHPFHIINVLTAVAGVGTLGGDEVRSSDDPYRQLDVVCACQGEHLGRPENTVGCGAAFRLTLRLRHEPA